MDVRQVIGSNLRRHRLAADLSQAAVAERMGVDRAYVSSLERGERNPTAITLWHAAQAIGVRIAELFDETELPAVSPPPLKKRASKQKPDN